MASIGFRLKSKENRQVSIYIYFRPSNSKVVSARTGQTINPSDWSSSKKKAKTTDPSLINLNTTLTSLEKFISQALNNDLTYGIEINNRWLNKQVDALIQNLDFAPTFLDYANANIPEDIQGESFRNIVNQKTAKGRDAIYYTYYEYPSVHMVKRHYGVRTERYKLMHFYYDIDEWELYDLEKDPSEMHNLYGQKKYAEVQKNMHIRLIELRTRYGDSDSLNQMHIERYLSERK